MCLYFVVRGSVVGKVIRLGTGRCGVRVQVGKKKFLVSKNFRPAMWGPNNLLSNRYRGTFPAVKRLVHAVDHSRTPSVEVKKKMELYVNSPPPHIFSCSGKGEQCLYVSVDYTATDSISKRAR